MVLRHRLKVLRRRVGREGYQYSDSSGGDLVLVDQSAEQVPPLDRLKPRRRDLGLLSTCWRLEPQATVRSGFVVMLGVDRQNPLEVSSASDECPVETLRTHRPDPPLGNALARGVRNGVRTTSTPSARKTRSWTRRVVSSIAPSTARFLACRVTQAESGWAVTPATWTFLVASSMKNST